MFSSESSIPSVDQSVPSSLDLTLGVVAVHFDHKPFEAGLVGGKPHKKTVAFHIVHTDAARCSALVRLELGITHTCATIHSQLSFVVWRHLVVHVADQ